MKHIYLFIVGLAFACITIVFDFFPRSEVSMLEQRRLTPFPTFSWQSLADGSFTEGITNWFSDTEPFRDEIMELSMQLKQLVALPRGEEAITLHHAETTSVEIDDRENVDIAEAVEQTADDSSETDNMDYERITLDEDAKIEHNGIIVMGAPPTVRAMMLFGGNQKGGLSLAEAVNTYQETLAPAQVYVMVVPIAIEFYCPEKVQRLTGPQLPVIRNCYTNLTGGARGINVYGILRKHREESIYLRTDHHWASLGAYYAACEFARVAGVHIPSLEEFDDNVVLRTVGSMYGYSEDIAIKQSPEDFHYFTPRDLEYTTTITEYVMDGEHVLGEKRPREGQFFCRMKDGSRLAYMTFLGGDLKHLQIKTSSSCPRRLLLIKDSYGNALPGFLFASFSEVHVADYRYFTRNVTEYVSENGITDVLILLNIFNANKQATGPRLKSLLTRPSLGLATTPASNSAPTTNDTAPKDSIKNDAETANTEDTESPSVTEATDAVMPVSE